MHSVRLEPTKVILIGTWTTYQATGDASLRVAELLSVVGPAAPSMQASEPGVGALSDVGEALVEGRDTVLQSSVCSSKLPCPRCEVRLGSSESLGSIHNETRAIAQNPGTTFWYLT